ncbi:hypothetical protein [Desertibacillus haloalkaliphilus]|uniref:hypothetical protein n=1 Tax=Desertibacillus haloalkaliphilus TaxID=1328930 RepID=UPI001C27002E|nr:hypothetical protein [Desertibacillus haloalkaliphilus]MBU8905422.1 hypothetical protein [Desertibacillus haloalkaliphilus]
MKICPLCNNLGTVEMSCTKCHHPLEDKGRLIDYFDDYSAYLEIDDMKKIDGIQNDLKNHECPHLLYCPNCQSDKVFRVTEWSH